MAYFKVVSQLLTEEALEYHKRASTSLGRTRGLLNTNLEAGENCSKAVFVYCEITCL
jgi:hypothetical protein